MHTYIIIYIYIYIYIYPRPRKKGSSSCRVYIYIYIYMFIYRAQARIPETRLFRAPALPCPSFGWHYLSNATCLIWPCLLYACFVVSRITIIC